MSNQAMTQMLAIGSLIIIGQGLSVLLSVLSFHVERHISKYLLAAYIILNCTDFFVSYYDYTKESRPGYFTLIGPLVMLEGGLFYLYVKSLLTPKFRLRRGDAIHLWPLLALIYTPYGEYIPGIAIPGLHYYLYLTAYLIACARLLPGYGRYIFSGFSSIDDINLDWLYKLIFVYLISSIVLLFEKIVRHYPQWSDPNPEITYIPNTFIFFIIFYLIAKSYRQQSLKPELTPLQQDSPPRVSLRYFSTPSKYQRSSLTQPCCEKLLRRMDDYMRKEEPFLDDDLTAAKLAAVLDITPYQLSQVLNTVLEQGFYDYINGYRVEKARQLIKKNDALPILTICDMSGFANKTTFYKHFRKHHGKTPLQYRKSLIHC